MKFNMKAKKFQFGNTGRNQGMRYIKETLKKIGTPEALEELAKIDIKTFLINKQK